MTAKHIEHIEASRCKMADILFVKAWSKSIITHQTFLNISQNGASITNPIGLIALRVYGQQETAECN